MPPLPASSSAAAEFVSLLIAAIAIISIQAALAE
jgi:hypothetical protein